MRWTEQNNKNLVVFVRNLREEIWENSFHSNFPKLCKSEIVQNITVSSALNKAKFDGSSVRG